MTATDELDVAAAATVLGVSVGRMYTLRCEGRGPVAWRRGRKLIYPRYGLDLYLARERESTLKGEDR